jgi:hypothetical protein
VPDDSRPVAAPVAIRITRPYATEDEFLSHELDTLTRSSVTLLGAQPRAAGVVLRFELALANGNVVLRGEGRVVGFKPNAYQGMGGPTLRFTRLDSRSKALVDKAAGLREQRRAPEGEPAAASQATPAPRMASLPPPPAPASLVAVPAQPFAVAPSVPPVSPVSPISPISPPQPPAAIPPPEPSGVVLRDAPRERMASDAEVVASEPSGASGASATAPVAFVARERDALLARLRTRASGLDAGEMRRMLADRKRA